MKRTFSFVKILCITLLLLAVTGFNMAGKVKYVEFSNLETELGKLENKKIVAGVVADEGSILAKYAAANEFGAVIKPKNGKYLAIPVQPEFKGKSPKDFPDGMFDFIPGKDWKTARLVMGNVTCFLLVQKVQIPERAFIRTAFDKRETQEKAYNLARAALERILGGGGRAEDLCDAIGQSLVSSIKINIASNIEPPNSNITSRMKGETKTLIDSGDLLKSIGYTVEG